MWDVRTIDPEEGDLFRSRTSLGFGRDPDTDDAARERFHAIFELDRTFAAFDGDDMVGTASGFSLALTVPGGHEVPMAGLTVVTVQPTHRRRGILRQLMSDHLDQVSERGEPLSGLWASEGGIYSRFGYGMATFRHKTKIDASSTTLRTPARGRVRLVDKTRAEPIVRSLYEQVRSARAGMLSRSDAWWAHRVLADVESWREGRSALRYAVHTEDGEPTGYAAYRQEAKWDDFGPSGEVAVEELVTTTHAAHESLWGYLLDIDLFPKVEYWNLPTDDPLPALVGDAREVRRTVSDALWVRIVDVPAALAARGYETDGTLSVSVVDEFRPGNDATYLLSVTGGSAICERVEGPGDVRLDIEALGHLYLGAGNAMVMAAGGRLAGDPTSLRTLHRLFRTDAAPWCPEVF
ncbi:MAG: GNAT family N-acetyltransferase [Acidimicrobiia bacterium]